jgi:uncharacterized membrane protein
MNLEMESQLSRMVSIVFDVLDPIPYGFFAGALIFDAIYSRTAEMLWVKSAAWLIAIGLVFAVLPRLINLARTWFRHGRRRDGASVASFWLSFAAIAAAILNAFVHSRDAYAVMPEGLWLSVVTMILLVLARAMPTLRRSAEETRS